MKFKFTVLLFVAVILNICINISESMDEPAAKERIKNNIKKIMEKGIKVEQHHFNELADKEVLRAEAKTYGTRMQEDPRLSIITDWVVEHGLQPYGPVYDRIRSHVATDLTDTKKEIKRIVNSKKFSNEEEKQKFIDTLARQKTAELLEQEREYLIRDEYSPGTINRLLKQRGLLGEGDVYEELRQPFKLKKYRAQSMDLQLSKDRIQDGIMRKKRPHRPESQDEYRELAEEERARLEDEYRAIAARELPQHVHSERILRTLIWNRGLLRHQRGCITRELSKPPSVVDSEKQATEPGRFFERGGGSYLRL